MEIDISQELYDLVWGISETRGVENVRLVHSILVEVCRHLEKQRGDDILSEIIQLLDKPHDSEVMRTKEYLFFLVYHNFLTNIRHGIDPPDSSLEMQSCLPCFIEENLQKAGISDWEIYDIFTKGVKNVDINKLWPIYKNNEHVIAEGFSVEQN
jgi:hypothetical protein